MSNALTSPEIQYGVLRQLRSHADLPTPLGLVPVADADRILLTPTHAHRLRNQLIRAVQLLGWYGERLDALLDATDALVRSALRQGVGGELQLRTCSAGNQTQVWVRHHGQNDTLTPALRQALTVCDQVSYLMDEEGTTWVIEQARDAPPAT